MTPRLSRRGGRRLAGTVVAALTTLAGIWGCSTDSAFAPSTDPSALFWGLRVDQHAVQLSLSAPENAVQLAATSYTPFGDEWMPAPGDSAPPTFWYSTDSSKVTVTQAGVVTAKAPTTSAIRVIAIRRINNVTQADTSQIRVVSEPTPRVLQTLDIRPTDSAKVATGINKPVLIRVTDSDGNAMNGVVAYVTSSDTSVAKPQVAWSAGSATTQVTIQGRHIGSALITAVTSVYGVAKTDTFTLVVGYPITGSVNISSQRQGDGTYRWLGYNTAQEVGPGAIVSWVNNSAADSATGQPIDVIFDTPEGVAAALPDNTHPNPAGGNISAIPADTGAAATATRTRYRRFLTPGTYPYHIPQYDISGTVVVKPE
jgi:hypothetical protein